MPVVYKNEDFSKPGHICLGIQERHLGWRKQFESHQLVFRGTGVREIPWHITRKEKLTWDGPRGYRFNRGRWQGSSSQRRRHGVIRKVKTTKGVGCQGAKKKEQRMMHTVKSCQELMAGKDWIWLIGFSKQEASW